MLQDAGRLNVLQHFASLFSPLPAPRGGCVYARYGYAPGVRAKIAHAQHNPTQMAASFEQKHSGKEPAISRRCIFSRAWYLHPLIYTVRKGKPVLLKEG